MPQPAIPPALEAVAHTVREAIREKRQLLFTYDGYQRVACPHSLGWKGERLTCFAWQFLGGSASGLDPGGEWRCLFVDRMEAVTSRKGFWHTGSEVHLNATCIDVFLASVEAG